MTQKKNPLLLKLYTRWASIGMMLILVLSLGAVQASAASLAVTKFRLVKGNGDSLGTLKDGAKIDLAKMPATWHIVAAVKGNVESVKFKLNSKIEIDNKGRYQLDGPLKKGSYKLTAIPFTKDGARGNRGTRLQIRFRVIDSGSASEPAPDSGGDSGPVASGCNPSGGKGGLGPGGHVTTIGGLNASIVVGDGYDPKKPTYLTYYIHGDSGNWSRYAKSSNPLNKFVRQKGWVMVVPEAPNGKSWWKNWKGDQVNAFAKVMEAMFANYNLCRNIVFGSSGSGGGVFWTNQFFPAKGKQYPAHMLLACGAGTASSSEQKKIKELGMIADVVKRSTMHYVYGKKDKQVSASIVEGSINLFKNAGFTVSNDALSNGGHCSDWKNQGLPSLADWQIKIWGQFAKKFG